MYAHDIKTLRETVRVCIRDRIKCLDIRKRVNDESVFQFAGHIKRNTNSRFAKRCMRGCKWKFIQWVDGEKLD